MAEITQDQVPKGIKNLFTKGYSAVESGNFDYAIELLSKCVELCPEFLRARRTLRVAELARLKKKGGGGLSAKFASLTGMGGTMKARGLIKKEPLTAVVAAESLLRTHPLHVPFVRLFADAAEAAGLPEAATMTLEVAREECPGDIDLVKHLAYLYQRLGNYAAARECFEKLVEARPSDNEAMKLLKDMMARASMEAGRWEQNAQEGGSYQDMLANKDEAQSLERANKAVTGAEDAQLQIDELTAKITAEPANLNYQRQIIRVYRNEKRFEEALTALAAAKKLAGEDPELDRIGAETKTQFYDAQIAAKREADDEAGAVEVENERNQFVFDNTRERVERYPNDAHLRYELGCLYFQYDYIDEAIQQFQLAQRSPKDRVMALYFLGMSFKSKGQNDMALMQLEEASTSIPRMDDVKKDILYEIGEVHESLGDAEKALENFKKIYSVDIGYKDIAKRVEMAYETKAAGAKA